MMDGRSPLERRFRERSYEKGSQAGADILQGLGIASTEHRVVSLDVVEALWPRYLKRLSEYSNAAQHFPVGEGQAVQDRLDRLSDALGSLSAVWLAFVDSEPVGVETSARSLIRVALTYFVTGAGDLMLTTWDAADGLCLELNHLATGDEYEMVVWGAFARCE